MKKTAHRPRVRHSQQLSSVTPGYHLMDGLDQMLPSTWALTVQDVWFSQKETNIWVLFHWWLARQDKWDILKGEELVMKPIKCRTILMSTNEFYNIVHFCKDLQFALTRWTLHWLWITQRISGLTLESTLKPVWLDQRHVVQQVVPSVCGSMWWTVLHL